jgi:hypothetical protein
MHVEISKPPQTLRDSKALWDGDRKGGRAKEKAPKRRRLNGGPEDKVGRFGAR